MGYQTLVKSPILAGTTPRITFQILDEDGIGLQPATLTYSVYGVDFSTVPAIEAIVNDRNDVDISANVDTTGHVELVLSSDDTAVDVPAGATPSTIQRRILLTWTWDTNPVRVGKHELILTIAPDRETEAA